MLISHYMYSNFILYVFSPDDQLFESCSELPQTQTLLKLKTENMQLSAESNFLINYM
jgi:hypothetical protein